MSISHLGLLLSLVALALCAPFNDLNAFGYNPDTNYGATVNAGNARFTVLTEAVIRMEYSRTQAFEDRATLMVVNRRLPVPSFTRNEYGNILTIATKQVTLKYQLNQPFSAATLSAKLASGETWNYSDPDRGNLFGTVRSLDRLCTVSLNCTENSWISVHDESLHCGWGVVSRSGWTIVDDTGNYILSAKEGEWFNNSLKSRDDTDMYFFGHGKNYRQALYDYTRIAGNIPMLQKPMLGAWFTRWYDYDTAYLQRVIDEMGVYTIPLDVMVLDMNWHTKHDWTGFSWDRQLFPFPNDTLATLHSQGLLTSANIHDATGIGKWEESYAQMCAATGHPNNGDTIPFQPLSEKYMHALDDITLKQTGFDFYWIDWQQGGTAGGCAGDQMNPTTITNHVRGTYNMRKKQNLRDGILARWGGMGNHRYPVGFSADVKDLSWQCFAYQPYFSTTAANVGYGTVSNDLIGPSSDPELHVRWMQFGAFSGVMRIHDRGESAGNCENTHSCGIVNVWELPAEYLNPIRDVMQQRVSLMPYIYTASRMAFDSGVSVMYPVYYDWPEHTAAYAMDAGGEYSQYMFGSDMMIAPVVSPANKTTMLAGKTIWLPPALWYDDVFGTLIQGGVTIRRNYHLDEVPVFIRAGAIIPRIPTPVKMGAAREKYTSLDIYIYPGANSSSYKLYEDDGLTLDYLSGQYAYTTISYKRTDGTVTFTIDAITKSFNGAVSKRNVRIFLVGTMPLSSVSSGSGRVPYSRLIPKSGQLGYSYDGRTATAVVSIGEVDVSTWRSESVVCSLAVVQNDAQLAQMKGFASHTLKAKHKLDNVRETPASTTVGEGLLKQAASYADALSYLAGSDIAAFTKAIGAPYHDLVVAALKEIGASPVPPPPVDAPALTQWWHEGRTDMLLCGSQDCVDVARAYNYTFMWAEGHQPPVGAMSRVPLVNYWSSKINDNYATVDTNTPNGYMVSFYPDGYVSSQSGNMTRCLQVWFGAGNEDFMTVASAAGLQWAKDNGYVQTQSCIGYVHVTPPPAVRRVNSGRTEAAFGYAIAMLQAALNGGVRGRS